MTLTPMKAALAVLTVLAGPVQAQDFSQGSEAATWGLAGEAPARFEAQVVDLLCTVTGDCPADCGAGHRQLGLLRTADQTLIFPLKNGEPVFTGAAVELAPYCGAAVEVDGLLISNPDTGAANIYMVQKIRRHGETDWTAATRWTEAWAAANHDAGGDDPWFRRDPRVNAAIAKDGYLGLGQDVDKTFIADWF